MSWFGKLFGNTKTEIKNINPTAQHKIETEQFFIEKSGEWRWIRREISYYPETDHEEMRGRITKPFDKDTSFEDASARSLAFHGDFHQLLTSAKSDFHYDLRNEAGKRGYMSSYSLPDGSSLSESGWYWPTGKIPLNITKPAE